MTIIDVSRLRMRLFERTWSELNDGQDAGNKSDVMRKIGCKGYVKGRGRLKISNMIWCSFK